MGQGLYRCVGWGCLNHPQFDWDNDQQPFLFDVVQTAYEAQPDYIMIPFGVDDEHLQAAWNLPALPEGATGQQLREAVVELAYQHDSVIGTAAVTTNTHEDGGHAQWLVD